MAETTSPKPATCGCLCGENVAPRSTFRQGHDQRMVGELGQTAGACDVPEIWIRRLELPDNVNEFDIVDLIAVVADAVSKHYSPSLGNKVYSAAERAWHRSGKAKPANLLEEAERGPEDKKEQRVLDLSVSTEQEYEVTPGAPVRVKVGRWEYDATVHGMNQAGKITAVRYYNKNEKEIVKTEGEFILI